MRESDGNVYITPDARSMKSGLQWISIIRRDMKAGLEISLQQRKCVMTLGMREIRVILETLQPYCQDMAIFHFFERET